MFMDSNKKEWVVDCIGTLLIVILILLAVDGLGYYVSGGAVSWFW